MHRTRVRPWPLLRIHRPHFRRLLRGDLHCRQTLRPRTEQSTSRDKYYDSMRKRRPSNSHLDFRRNCTGTVIRRRAAQ
ncbi:hypothetical protein GQ600_9437 [Phytophthora cactorum]|nr:hypothetical protein GQ600_9437 [Phytophthora cactorum]